MVKWKKFGNNHRDMQFWQSGMKTQRHTERMQVSKWTVSISIRQIVETPQLV